MIALTALSFADPHDFDADAAAGAPAEALGVIRPRPMTRAEIAAMTQPFRDLRSYRLVLSGSRDLPDDDAGWIEGDHTVTVVARDRLFVDDVEIDPGRWRWSADGTTLRWCHGSGAAHLAGELCFDGVGHRAAGSVAFGERRAAAVAIADAARFSCRLKHDPAVAYTVTGGALKWLDNEAFRDPARWSGEALAWSFWVEEYVNEYGERSYRPRVRFEDTQTGESFEPEPGTFTAFVDAELRYHFELNADGRPTPAVDRSRLDDERDRAIKTVFPIRLVLRLDPAALRVQGAFEVERSPGATEVYAVSGEARGGALLRVAAKAREAAPRAAAEVAAAGPGELGEYYLYNLDPYEMVEVRRDKTLRDAVQAEAEKSFAKIIQSYLPEDARRSFISAAPIDLDPEVRAIAVAPTSTGEAPKAFYESLTRPYLTMILSGQSERLNARRARKRFDDLLAKSPVYREHMVALYALHFRKKFPAFQGYLADEGSGLDEKRRQIEHYTSARIATYERRKAEAETDAGRQQCDAMIAEARTTGEKAIAERRYWAHRVYTHFTGDAFVNTLKMQIFASPDGSGARAATRTVQRVSTILSVLDPSQFFAERFAEFMRIFRLFSIVAQHADLSGQERSLREVADEVAKRFADEHATSTDETTKLIAEIIRDAAKDRQSGKENLWAKALEIVYEIVLSGEKVGSLAAAMSKLMSRIAEKVPVLEHVLNKLPQLGEKLKNAGLVVKTVLNKVMHVAVLGVGTAFVVVTLAQRWDELDAVAKGGLITIGVGLLASFAMSIVKGGLKLAAVWSMSSGMGAFRWAMGLKVQTFWGPITAEAIEAQMQGAAEWLLSKLTGRNLGAVIARGGLAGKVAQASVRLLANVARVVLIGIAAVMSIVSIVMSAIELSKAKTVEEKAMHGLMIAAGGLELIGLAFSLASVVAVGTAATVLTIISAAFTGLALVVALVGIGLMIWLMTRPLPNPVEDFVNDEAKKEDSLAMPGGTAIDYLLPLYDDSGRLLREGVAVAGLGSDDKPSRYLTIGNHGAVTSGSLTNDQATCFGLELDDRGGALVFAATVPESEKIVPRYLTVTEDRKLVAEAEILKTARHRQRWIVELAVEPEHLKRVERIESNLVRARFRLHVVMNDKKLYLRLDGASPAVGEAPEVLELALVSTKPFDLRMSDVVLAAGDRDRIFYPYLGLAGCEPRSWSIRGALPAFLAFDEKLGTVKQREGVAPAISTAGPLHVAVKSGAGDELLSNPFKVVVTA